MSHPPRDLTPLPDLLHGAALAGPVRTRRPVYRTCSRRATRAARPGRTSRPGWLPCQAGEHERAWRVLTADNPLPAIHGRVCYHPCEDLVQPGRARQLGVDPFGRAVSRRSRARPRVAVRSAAARTGKRVLSSGRGRAACRRPITWLAGVTRSRSATPAPEPGGMMRYGIPAYRLPRDVLTAELARIEALGVRMTCGHRVTDLAAERAEGRFDAVFVAVGAHLSKHVDIPARDASRIIDAVPFLRDVAGGDPAGDRPPGRGVRRRQHGDGRGPGRPAARRPGHDDRLPAHPGADARTRGGGHGRRAGGRAHQLAAHDRRLRRAGADRRGHGTGRSGQAASDRADGDTRRRHDHHGGGTGRRHRVPAAGTRAWNSSRTGPSWCHRR